MALWKNLLVWSTTGGKCRISNPQYIGTRRFLLFTFRKFSYIYFPKKSPRAQDGWEDMKDMESFHFICASNKIAVKSKISLKTIKFKKITFKTLDIYEIPKLISACVWGCPCCSWFWGSYNHSCYHVYLNIYYGIDSRISIQSGVSVLDVRLKLFEKNKNLKKTPFFLGGALVSLD